MTNVLSVLKRKRPTPILEIAVWYWCRRICRVLRHYGKI
jgi:hypothetical protein